MKLRNCLRIFLCFLLISVFVQHAYGAPGLYDLEETPFGFYHQICPRQIGGGYDEKEQLPSEYFIRGITAVKDQNPLGTCVSFAASACCEYYHSPIKFSEAEFTILAQTDSTVGNKCTGGLFLGKALGVAKEYGFIEEERLPYDQYLKYVASINSQDLAQEENASICKIDDYNGTMEEMGVPLRLYGTSRDITNYRIGCLYPLHHVSKESLRHVGKYRLKNVNEIGSPRNADINNVRYQLSKNRPVAVALNVFCTRDKNEKIVSTNWDNNQLVNNHAIRFPRKTEEHVESHAIVLTGFHDDTQMFQLKNSWGAGWGNSGFAWISYDYIKNFSTELIAIGNPNN